MKIHCSVLAEDAIKSAIADYRKKQAIAAPAEVNMHAQASTTETTRRRSRRRPPASREGRRSARRGRPSTRSRARWRSAERRTPRFVSGIRGGGCSGFRYVIEFHDGAPRPKDRVFDYMAEDGTPVRVVVDKKSLVFLAGTELDWEQTLMQQGFKFKNPNEKTSCGCGHSFTV